MRFKEWRQPWQRWAAVNFKQELLVKKERMRKMTIQDLVQRCELQVLTGSALLDRTVRGCYIGDLLSWAMGKVRVDNAWLTVMGNVNAVAVAVLADAACIVLVDNATLDSEAEKKAIEQEVVILSTKENAYDLAIRISEMLQ